MHELATTKNVIKLCESYAAKEGFQRVTEIRLKVGRLSGIVPACLSDFFPYAAAGTACENAGLVFDEIPAQIRCEACGYEGETETFDCPQCGSAAIRITAGREFFVDSISVE